MLRDLDLLIALFMASVVAVVALWGLWGTVGGG